MFQQLIIVGNLGRDPEMRYTSAGVPVTTMSVATSRKWKDGDGKEHEETTWFRVSAWRNLAELCNQYLKKGRQVMVVGRVAASPYTAQDGTARASLEVTAETIKFLGGRTGAGDDEEFEQDEPSTRRPANGRKPAPAATEEEEEIPF